MKEYKSKNKCLSTEVTDEEIENCGVRDEYGVIYSADGKRLLDSGYGIFPEGLFQGCLKEYKVKKGTEIICDDAFHACMYLSSL